MAKMNIEIDTETKQINVSKKDNPKLDAEGDFKKISLVGEEDIRRELKSKGIKGIDSGDFRPALIVFTKESPGCVTYVINGRYYYV
jgi:hypothetical protein